MLNETIIKESCNYHLIMSGKIIVVLVFAVYVGALKFGVTIDR